MSGDEKVENAQEEPEDQVNEEEMNTEDVYESISQAMGVNVEFLDLFAKMEFQTDALRSLFLSD